jgi:hypothetical protein
VSIQVGSLPPTAAFFKAIAGLVDAANDQPSKLEVTNEYSTLTISTRKTSEQLDRALEAAQNEWDSQLHLYNTLYEEGDPEHTKSVYTLQNVQAWAKREQLPTEAFINLIRDAKHYDADKTA